MAGRTTEEVKHDLESERERLGEAVHTLRFQATRVRRKLPFVAVGITAVGVLAGLARKRVSGGDAPETGKRGRRSRFGRD